MTPDDTKGQSLNAVTVLLVVPDQHSLDYLQNILQFIDCDVHVPESPQELQRLVERYADRSVSVFLSSNMPDQDRSTYLSAINACSPRPALIQIQEKSGDEMLVSGDVLGTLRLPCQYDAISSLLHKAQVFAESQKHGEAPRRPLELFRSLSGNSRATRGINKMIEQVADSEATVLILGESGTGKEVVARKLHYHSKRRGRPFVPVNCGAIPGDLLESELFGHEKGAFTGAITARQGRFELAEGGTLFLDEIGDMSVDMQVKLLRVLQERTFERVGSGKLQRCNVRIIAATHKDLPQAVKDGEFREDLFYRLNVFPIEMPPLYQRVSDLPQLLEELLIAHRGEQQGELRVSAAAAAALASYSWPGNIRELSNLVERLAIIKPEGIIEVEDLPAKYRDAQPLPNAEATMVSEAMQLTNANLKESLQSVECGLIEQAMQASNGVVAKAARLLTMRRTTLVEKIAKYELGPVDTI